MCRIAGYLGPGASLASVLTYPPHSLRKQGREPRELSPGRIGADGYGYAWRAEGVVEPGRYRQILPIWSDPNLESMAPQIASTCFVASTRTANEQMSVAYTNTPPFCHGEMMLVHNGTVEAFHRKVAEQIRSELDPDLRAGLQGNTDSEYFAAVLHGIRGEDLAERVRELLRRARRWIERGGTKAALNFIVGERDQLVAVRYSVDEVFASLYYAEAHDGGTVIASEPLCETVPWTRMSESTMLVVRRQGDGYSRTVVELS